MTKITSVVTKEDLVQSPLNDANKIKASDINEIVSVVNANDDLSNNKTDKGGYDGTTKDLQDELQNAVFTGAKTYQTEAELLAVSPIPTNGTPAKVANDSDLSKNGYYSVVSGSWVQDSKNVLTPQYTLLVASDDATDRQKELADYVCNGTNDEAQINQAIQDLPEVYSTGSNPKGGLIQFTQGNFYIDGEINITTKAQITLKGLGNSTLFWKKNNAVRDSIINIAFTGFSSEKWEKTSIENIYFIGQSTAQTSAISCSKSHYITVKNCIFTGNNLYGVQLKDVNNSTIIDNYFISCQKGVYGIADSTTDKDVEDIIITNNIFTETLEQAIYFKGTTLVGGAEVIARNTISNNNIEACNQNGVGGTTDASIQLEFCKNLVVSNNIISETNTGILIKNSGYTVESNGDVNYDEGFFDVKNNNITEADSNAAIYIENTNGYINLIGNNCENGVTNNGLGKIVDWNDLDIQKTEYDFFIASSDAKLSIKEKADYVCDGTDDEVQINQAIQDLPNYYGGNTKGGTIKLSAGIFNINDEILIDFKGTLSIKGEGASTILNKQSGTTGKIINITQSSFSTELYEKNVIENIYFTSNSTDVCQAIYTKFCQFTTIKNCSFTGRNMTAIDLEDSNMLTIDNNTFNKCLVGIKGSSIAGDIEDNKILNNIFYDNIKECILLTATEITGARGIVRNLISNNIFRDNNTGGLGLAALSIDYGEYNNINNNTFQENNGISILIDNSVQNSIKDNSISECTTGISLVDTDDVTIYTNMINEVTTGVIIGSSCDNNQVVANNTNVTDNGTNSLVKEFSDFV